ncbi:putative GTPase [Bacillus sp. TS-2]|nr:putative GTPase [Bacillus sp. TS-2]
MEGDSHFFSSELEALLNKQEWVRKQQIIKKMESPVFEVAFCGHFSAGKSTIMNTILGAEILPTSPIPTSANIVSIANGNLGVSVQKANKEIKKWDGDIPWEQIRQWGMDGQSITDMRIFAPLTFLNNSIIYDTPGVDSTDPNHQKLTVEALFTTDVIIYVMEYNHVQSETNLYFLKQLSNEQKPIIILVNQVDKHNDKELSFNQFDESIKDTFKKWNIQYLDLFYTSMKKNDYPYNQFVQFEKKLKALLYHGNEVTKFSNRKLIDSFYLSLLSRLENDHEDWLLEKENDLQSKGFSLASRKQYELQIKEKNQLKEADTLLKKQLEEEWKKLFAQVTVFPYSTTELTRAWLESKDQKFKVGILFSKKKTVEEQQKRLDALILELNEKIKSLLNFHVIRSFEIIDKRQLTNRDQVEQALQQFSLNIDSEFFEESAIPSHISREFVFTFTKNKEAEIKKLLWKNAYDILELIIDGMKNSWETQLQQKEVEIMQLKSLSSLFEEISEKETDFMEMKTTITNELQQSTDESLQKRLLEISIRSYPENVDIAPFIDFSNEQGSVIETDWKWEPPHSNQVKTQVFNEEWFQEMEHLLRLDDYPKSFESKRNQLVERLKKHQNETFRLSLFGAFSAGKSSFANALLGKEVLPVSPHPTTATINTIKKSSTDHQNETAEIFFKSEEQLEKEIEFVSSQLGESFGLKKLKSWKPNLEQFSRSSQKTLAEYLLTVKKSFLEHEDWLEQVKEVSLNQVNPYIANEEVACLVNAITIYYDCPLTESGVELIDTPGVNSIHGRHTNVAFQQLKHSDAVFYLTYYNHAFSKADQWFLQQLSLVNDGFKDDKLYFVLNAADLAENERELNGVKLHVYNELKRNGLASPKLHHVSSKEGLSVKKGEKKSSEGQHFLQFEEQFYQETIQELKRLNIEILQKEVQEYVIELAEAIQFLSVSKSERERKLNNLKREKVELAKDIDQASASSVMTSITQELSELMVYLRERILFVFSDSFNEAINVTTITGHSKKQQAMALLEGLREYKNQSELFIKNELYATLVRIELKLAGELEAWYQESVEEIQRLWSTFSGSKPEIEMKLYQEVLPSLREIDPKSYLNEFKSTKHFFEEGGSKELKERVVNDAVSSARNYLFEFEKELETLLLPVVSEKIEMEKQHLKQEIELVITRYASSFSEKEQDALKTEWSKWSGLEQLV